MMCVLTRFHLKHWWGLVLMYLTYRRMFPDLRSAPGLIRHAFLIQDAHTCCTLSIWATPQELADFANVPSHLHAHRASRPWCIDIWSSYWKFDAVSVSAKRWPGDVPWPELRIHPKRFNRLTQPVAPGGRGE